MARDNVKMSQIMEHNSNHRTDELYNPLRNALKKPGFLLAYDSRRNSLTPEKLASSHLTRDLHMLTEAEAQHIRNTTFISSDRELVATRHIERVMGKHFYAVDVEQRIGEPITLEQMKQVNRNQFEEIVYEFKQNSKSSLFDLPHIKASSSVYNLKPVNTITTAYDYQRPSLKSEAHTDSHLPTQVQSRLPYDLGESSHSNSRINELMEGSGVKAYQFDQKMKSSKSSSSIELRGRRSDSEYKYNLFSIVDEPLNHGCKPGCFVGNEICAPRRAGSQWK